MNDYILICLYPLSKKRKVEIINYSGEEIAKKMAINKKKQGLDILLIKKIVSKNKFSGRDEEVFMLEKFGFFWTYNLINKIYWLFALILLCLILYLYYQYLEK